MLWSDLALVLWCGGVMVLTVATGWAIIRRVVR